MVSPIDWYDYDHEDPQLREQKFREEVCFKEAAVSPNGSKIVTESCKELLVRSTQATIEAFMYALVFEHDLQLVTKWPRLIDCLNAKNPSDINSLVEVEQPATTCLPYN
jgi:hypothetical protein